MSADNKILKVKNLCKYFPLYSNGLIRRVAALVKAVDEVSFELTSGQTLGLVGESGCGKTTMCRTILRALKPTSGSALFKENNNHYVDLATIDSKQLRTIRRKIQMIFQDPFSSLNPRMTIGSIVGEPLVIHKITKSRSELQDAVSNMLKKVGLLPEHANRFPYAFSGGQRQRIAIARALILQPSLIICDEAVSALDVSVQAQIINLLEDLQSELNLTYIFVAHDLSVVRHISDTIAVMYAGRIVELGPAEAVFEDPKHPYTVALLSAVPLPDPGKKLSLKLFGEPPDLAHLPAGCSFHPRCPHRFGPCTKEKPVITETTDNHLVACHLYG